MEEKCEGVLLQAIPYLGQKKILKVFTPELGLISLMAKSSGAMSALTHPFCTAEWVFFKGKKELHTLKDGSLLDPLPELKATYERLSAAGLMAQDLLRSQLPGKGAEPLYRLFLAYLKKLPLFEDPQTAVASFRLKLLAHEGLLSLKQTCATCDAPSCSLHQGESYCARHKPFGGALFTKEEWEKVAQLTFERKFSEMEKMREVPKEKIQLVFAERMKI